MNNYNIKNKTILLLEEKQLQKIIDYIIKNHKEATFFNNEKDLILCILFLTNKEKEELKSLFPKIEFFTFVIGNTDDKKTN